MSAIGGKANIERDPSICPLMTQSGHSAVFNDWFTETLKFESICSECMAFYAVTYTDDYVWATLSMSTVENLLAASKPNSALIAADRKIDKQTKQAGTGPREEASQTKHVGKTTVRNIDFDAETQTVIFQTIDENTDSVISQYPSEAQLNLSAYLKTVTAPKAQSVSFNRSA